MIGITTAHKKIFEIGRYRTMDTIQFSSAYSLEQKLKYRQLDGIDYGTVIELGDRVYFETKFSDPYPNTTTLAAIVGVMRDTGYLVRTTQSMADTFIDTEHGEDYNDSFYIHSTASTSVGFEHHYYQLEDIEDYLHCQDE